MATKIFVNLPVMDLAAAMKFYDSIGFKNNPHFTDDTAACMVLTEDIYVMLLTHKKFAEFTSKAIADGNKTTEVINCISQESKEEVNALADNAMKAGAAEAKPLFDLGFMYSRSFHDLDGHIWEIMWMDPAAAEPQG